MANVNNEKYNANDYIYIVCKQARYIKPLRMSGPIIAPLKVRMNVAWQIICSGITLYQYNPPTKEFVLMTMENAWYKNKFKQTPTNKPSLMTSQETSQESATMSLRSAAPAPVENDNEDDDDVKEVKTPDAPNNNSSNNSNKKKKKNKQNQAQQATVKTEEDSVDPAEDETVEEATEDPVVDSEKDETKDEKAE